MTVIFEVGEGVVIRLGEDKPCNFVEVGKDVSCTSMVFSSLVSGSKLTIRHQQIDIVGAYKTLSHVDNSHSEGHLAMVIS